MARSDAVWGIDIGQCALKAVRCRSLEDGRAVADAFDYVEYPKILSQPEADPAALIHDALQQFLSRNSVRGDRVAVSVPGQSGLARFIKLPPVESKKIPNIVKYEARQQIPFALDDVVWDYQKMVGGSEEEGFALETEVGLFAMKRDQVFRSLKPFDEAGIEVDIVQLTPLALYNFVAFDQIENLPAPEDYDPENPPESIVVISLGTDSTDLVVTNGYRVWQRSVPIGGNHFTKALTKELKLTFATAEHLKRNAAKAEDPKALFQAMRPVFNDLLTEVQRSVGYFTNLDRRAKIGRALALGNAMKLPGLQRYLAQNLGLELGRVDAFRTLSGPAVVDAPAFKDNVLSFGVSYGLALQGLRVAKIKTNLLPREIVKDRMIRAKKPWAVGAAAALLLGCAVSYFGDWRVWRSVEKDFFASAVARANKVSGDAASHATAYKTAQDDFAKTTKIEQNLLPNQDVRVRWLELLKIIDVSLPRNPDPEKRPDKIEEREEILITSIVWKHVDDLGLWYTDVSPHMDQPVAAPIASEAVPPGDANATAIPSAPPTTAIPTAPPGASPDPMAAAPAAVDPATGMPLDASGAPPADVGLTAKPGWIVQLSGHHYHNKLSAPLDSDDLYLKKTLIKNLKSEKLPIPPGERKEGGPTELDLKKLGIGFPVMVEGVMDLNFLLVDPTVMNDEAQVVAAGAAPPNATKIQPRYTFIVQFCWQDSPGEPAPAAGDGTDATTGSLPVSPPPVPAEAAVAPAEVPPPAGAPPAAEQPAAAAPAAPPATPPAADGAPLAVPGAAPAAPMPGTVPAAGPAPPPAAASPATPPPAVPMPNQPMQN